MRFSGPCDSSEPAGSGRWRPAPVCAAVLLLAACADPASPGAAAGDLLDALRPYCGQAFEGRVTSAEDPRDADMAGQRLVMHVRACSEDEIQAPFHVGQDRSRTWIVTRLGDGRLRLKHDHRHEDGSEDALTQYGGETLAPPAGVRAEFPADDFSRDLFEAEGIPDSMQNVWIMEVAPGGFIYALTRPNRHFEATFDLTRPVAAPLAPWGYEGD